MYLGWAAAPIFLLGLESLFDWRKALLGASIVAGSLLVLLWFRRASLHDQPAHKHEEGSIEAPFAFLKLPSIWMCWGFFFLTALALSGIQSFAPSALQAIYNVPLTLTATAYTCYMLSSAGGMVLGGLAASRFGNPDRIIAGAFIMSGVMALIAGFGFLPGESIPVIFGLMGLGAGVAGPSRDLMIRAATPKGSTGRVYGMVYSGLDMGMSLGPIMFGFLMDWKLPPVIFFGIALFQVLAIFTAVRLTGRTANSAVTA